MRRLSLGKGDGLVEQWLVRHEAGRLDATACRDDHFGRRIVDSDSKFFTRETAEYDRMDRPDPRAGQHRHDGLGHHRHVNDDPVTALDAKPAQHPGKAGHQVEQFFIGDLALVLSDRAVVDNRGLRRAPGADVPIDGVVTGVHYAVGEPAIERRARVVEQLLRLSIPVDIAGRAPP